MNNCKFILIGICCYLTILIQFSSACDIVGASACPHRPDNELKEENFPIYCEQFKKNLECVAKKYKGCDRMDTYTLAMKSMIQVLKRKAKEIEELCKISIDLQETKPTRKTTTTTKATKKTTKKKNKKTKINSNYYYNHNHYYYYHNHTKSELQNKYHTI